MNPEQETHSYTSPEPGKRTIGPTTVNMSIGTAVVAILAWATLEFAGIDVPAHVGLAVAFIINIFVGWATKPSTGRRAA